MLGEVTSALKKKQFFIGWIFWASKPIIRELIGDILLETWDQLPGAAHKSIIPLDFSKILYFLSISINLKAALERNPCFLAKK